MLEALFIYIFSRLAQASVHALYTVLSSPVVLGPGVTYINIFLILSISLVAPLQLFRLLRLLVSQIVSVKVSLMEHRCILTIRVVETNRGVKLATIGKIVHTVTSHGAIFKSSLIIIQLAPVKGSCSMKLSIFKLSYVLPILN